MLVCHSRESVSHLREMRVVGMVQFAAGHDNKWEVPPPFPHWSICCWDSGATHSATLPSIQEEPSVILGDRASD